MTRNERQASAAAAGVHRCSTTLRAVTAARSMAPAHGTMPSLPEDDPRATQIRLLSATHANEHAKDPERAIMTQRNSARYALVRQTFFVSSVLCGIACVSAVVGFAYYGIHSLVIAAWFLFIAELGCLACVAWCERLLAQLVCWVTGHDEIPDSSTAVPGRPGHYVGFKTICRRCNKQLT